MRGLSTYCLMMGLSIHIISRLRKRLFLLFFGNVLLRRFMSSSRKRTTAPGDRTFGSLMNPSRLKLRWWSSVRLYGEESSSSSWLSDGMSKCFIDSISTKLATLSLVLLSASVTYQSHQAWLSCSQYWFKSSLGFTSKSLESIFLLITKFPKIKCIQLIDLTV